MRWRIAIGAGIVLILGAGTSVATYRHWVEPSPGLLAAEGGGELVEGETRVIDSITTPEGATVQLVTYLTTGLGRCFDATVETSAGPAGASGGCGARLDGKDPPLEHDELKILSEGNLNVEGLGYFLTTIGVAGQRVNQVRHNYSDGTSELRPVDPQFRVWLAVSSPSRSSSWEAVIFENAE